MNNKILCEKHGIVIHRLSDTSYTNWPDGTPISDDELTKLMVSTPATFDAKVVESIPLAETQEAAEALAVEYIKIR